MSDDDPEYGYRYERLPVPWRTYLGYALIVLAVLGAVAFALAPSPYVVERPGPVYDTLGDVETSGGDEVPLIDIPEARTYPTSGRLDLLTVYIDGSRQRPLSWIDVATSWFDPSRAVLPIDSVYPVGQTDEESDAESAQAMADSQQDAVAAALGELGIPFESSLVVAGIVADGASEGVLEVDDEILAVAGREVTDIDQLRDALQESGIGVPVDLTIVRDGVEREVTLVPAENPRDGSAAIGVYAATRYEEFPIEVDILLENVGGPSAGMMFALGIYDKLTPGQLTGGEHIAGTGTIGGSGEVGPIGGIVQKMYGARDAGAAWFLAPVANCGEVVGNVPAGLEVFAVDDLGAAIDAVEAIADGEVSQLPRCD